MTDALRRARNVAIWLAIVVAFVVLAATGHPGEATALYFVAFGAAFLWRLWRDG